MVFYGYMQSDSLSKENFSNLFSQLRGQIGNQTVTREEAQQYGAAVKRLANAGTRAELDMSYINFSFQTEKFGGLAFNVIDNYRVDTRINTDNANVIFQGNWNDLLDSVSIAFDGDSSKIEYRNDLGADTLQSIYALHLQNPLDFNKATEGSRFKMAWNRVYNLGYGRKLFGKDSLFILYGGVGARFIQSIAQIDFESDGESSYLHTSLPEKAQGRNGSVAHVSPLSFSSVGGFFPDPVGYGYGLDFSASAILFKKFRVAAAVNNIGSVTYKQKVYAGKSSSTETLFVDGLDPNNFENDIRELINGTQLVEFVEEREFTIPNAAVVRIGGSFTPIKQASFGLEFIAPYSKKNAFALEKPIFAAGIELKPLRWLTLTSGYFGGGVYDGQIPLGVNFVLRGGKYEIGISSRDMLQFVDGGADNVSTAFGVARVRF